MADPATTTPVQPSKIIKKVVRKLIKEPAATATTAVATTASLEAIVPAWIPPTYPLKLDKLHAHERDSRIQFDEPTHIYTVDGDSKSYRSVTTLIHGLCMPFDPDETIKKMMRGPNWFKSPYYGMKPEEIKKKWTDSGAEASGAGTKMHLHIEYWYNDVLLPEPDTSIEFQYFLRYQEKVGSRYIPWRTEWSVFFEEAHISGQIDMVYKNERGKFTIADWKRAKEIKTENKYQQMLPPVEHLPDTNYWHYACQLNIYRYILQTKYGMEIDELFLVVLHPNNSSFIKINVPFLDREVEQIFANRIEDVRNGTAAGSRLH